MRNAYKMFIRKSEWKRPLWSPVYNCEDTIKVDVKEMVLEDVDWIHVAQGRDRQPVYARTAMNIRDA